MDPERESYSTYYCYGWGAFRTPKGFEDQIETSSYAFQRFVLARYVQFLDTDTAPTFAKAIELHSVYYSPILCSLPRSGARALGSREWALEFLPLCLGQQPDEQPADQENHRNNHEGSPDAQEG